MQWLAKIIYFKILGWQVIGNKNFSKDTIKKAVIIAAPHTSWRDLLIGILLRSVVNVKTHFLAKKELFSFPFGYFFRSVGGIPTNRSSSENRVELVSKLFDLHVEYRIALAPEGTRKKVKFWRTGFYHIAKQAQVPLIMFTLDFKNKLNYVSEPFYPTTDIEADFQYIQAFFKGVKGKISNQS